MKKVFLAAPFKSLVNSKTMSMDEEKKNEIVNLIEFLEKKGYSVHNAHKREAWGQEFMSGYIKDVSGKLIRSRSSSRQLNPLSSSLSFLSPAGNRRGSFCALNHSPE